MTSIWLNPRHDRLKSYSATAKGGRSVVKIEIDCNEPGSLGYLLSQLGEIERDQQAAERALKEAARAKSASKRKPLAISAPPLQLPYFGEDDL